MMPRILLCLLLLTNAACAARSAAPAQESDPASWEGDPRLYRMLSAFPLAAADNDSLTAYTQPDIDSALEQLAIAAEDLNAPSTVRANALFTLARLQAVYHLDAFRIALDDPDVRVRATAVAAMREFLSSQPLDALQIARLALRDSAAEVQAQALQILGDTDVALLRSYLVRGPSPELARIARELVAVAEERGAPLVRDSATGVLRRTSAHGHVVEFTPTQRWPQWDAAVGRVTVRTSSGAVVTLDGIEAVGGVVPLFFSPDGGSMVYERNREIMVRDVAAGTERSLGAGIAPRPSPFTEQFVFAREAAGDNRTEQRERTMIRYEILLAPFRGTAAPTVIAAITAGTTFGQRGGYSPLRWAHIEERSGSFYLAGDNMEAVALPDPFSGRTP